MELKNYLMRLDPRCRKIIMPIVEHMQEHYSEVPFYDHYLDITDLALWRKDHSYVSVKFHKTHVAIYFSPREAVNIISQQAPLGHVEKGCIHFTYRDKIPYTALCQGIDYAFSHSSR